MPSSIVETEEGQVILETDNGMVSIQFFKGKETIDFFTKLCSEDARLLALRLIEVALRADEQIVEQVENS